MIDGSVHTATNTTPSELEGMTSLLNRGPAGEGRITVKGMTLMVRHIVRFKVEQ